MSDLRLGSQEVVGRGQLTSQDGRATRGSHTKELSPTRGEAAALTRLGRPGARTRREAVPAQRRTWNPGRLGRDEHVRGELGGRRMF
jgi:hypothetical protein